MLSDTVTKRVWWAAEAAVIAATVAICVIVTHPSEWQPLGLLAFIVVLTLVGERFSVDTSAGQLTASFIAIVLAMVLLGPVPATACGVALAILHSAIGRRPPALWLNNLMTFSVAPLVGGFLIVALGGHLAHRVSQSTTDATVFGLVALFSMLASMIVLNFALFAVDVHIEEGRPYGRLVRELFLPLLPGQLAAGGLAILMAVAYLAVGLPMLFASAAILLIVQHLTVALLRSEHRAEQLEARSRQLVGLQLGVLRTLVRALAMRDNSSARHAAAVARYAKALAADAGCTEEEVDSVHAAGLLHEIGKFTWPDRVLHAETIAAEDESIVRNHPQEGAVLVGSLDGYGPVAEAILYHHERMDGRGYPAGLIGKEIPLLSRILAVCSVYDTVHAGGDGYRATELATGESIEELRRAAENGQLDPELVDRFVALLEREGQRFEEETDFETELEFERRARDLAEPRGASTGGQSGRPAGAPASG